MAAGIVLVGGRSSRMGCDKAALEWHGSTLLRRTTGMLARTVGGPVIVVGAPGREPPWPGPAAELAEDPVEGRGPLQGIATGLAAVAGRADIAFVCSTDLPFLHPAFIRRVLAALDGDTDVVTPDVGGFRQPLAAAYRTALAPLVGELVAADLRRPASLFERCRLTRLDGRALLADPVLAALDPQLDSVLNVNGPAEYDAARSRAAPDVTLQRCGALAAGRRGAGPVAARAATLAAAAAAAGLALDGRVIAAVDGGPPSRDPELPLATGDTVAFHPADPAA